MSEHDSYTDKQHEYMNYNHPKLSRVVPCAGAATAQGPPERPQEGIAAAAGALIGQLARQLVPEAIISMAPGMSPADLAPRPAPNGPAAPAPAGMGQVQLAASFISNYSASPQSISMSASQ